MVPPRILFVVACCLSMLALPITTAEGAKKDEDVFASNPANLTQITPWNFDDVVGRDNHVLVLFAAPWCGACKKYYPKYIETAFMLNSIKGLVLAKADVTEFEYEELQENLQVGKVPAIKIFKKGSSEPVAINPQEAWEMHFQVKEKLGMAVPNKCMFGDSDAEDVTTATWDKLVMDPKLTTLVEFYAPWCKHCQALKPTYNNIARKASKLPGVKVVRLNVDKEKALGEKYKVKKLPSLMIFSRQDKEGIPYEMPDASEHLEMVDKILKRLQAPDSTDQMEAHAAKILKAARETKKNGDFGLALGMLEDNRAALNMTKLWHRSIVKFEQELQEEDATRLKEEASELAGQGKFLEALPLLERITKEYKKTKMAKSEVVENLVHNCKAMAAQAK